MCTAFSRLQQLNFKWKSLQEVKEIMNEAMKHIEFCMYLYEIQAKPGLYFLHEHLPKPMQMQTAFMLLAFPKIDRSHFAARLA